MRVLIPLLFLLIFDPAFAQNTSSSLKGVLKDPAGAAVPRAACVIVNQATGATLTTASTQDGGFTFPNILPGTYALTVKAAGFKTLETTAINVTASEFHALGTLTLQIGEVRESISITAEAAALQLISAEKSGLITGKQLNDIAVKGRDFFALMSTVTGVVDDFSQTRETAGPRSIGGTFINGSRSNQKSLAVDGIVNLDTGSNNTVHFQPNMDSIAEIKIMTSNFQAEFGRNGGGVVTVITKSGSKDFHGTAYDFYRHESLNANSFFDNRTGTPKSPYRFRVSGYSIGGPVYIPKKFNSDRSKLFFFWSQEYVGRRKEYGTRFVNTPTELERNGDFSRSFDVNGALLPIKDPLTGVPFPGNVIPRNRINNLGQSIVNFYPQPNFTDPDPRNRYSRNHRSRYSGPYPKRQDMVRIDTNLWPSLQIYGRFVQDKDEENSPYGLSQNGKINFFLTPLRVGLPGKGAVIHLTKIFSPTLVNDFTFGKSHNEVYFDVVNQDVVNRSKMGNPPEWYPDPEVPVKYLPDVTFGGTPVNSINASLNAKLPKWDPNNIYSFVDNLSIVRGAHSIKTGIYVERSGETQGTATPYRGAFDFSRNANNPFDSGHGFANALLGNFVSYSESTKQLMGDFWFWNVEWYVQDNWRVSKRLTLDLGMRFYHMPPMEDTNRTLATFDPTLFDRNKIPALYVPAKDSTGRRVARDPVTGTLAIAPLIGQFVPGSGDYANGTAVGGKNGYPSGLFTYPWISFGPRLGFAYDAFGNGKTAVRGGFGMFKDRMAGNPTYNTSGNPPTSYTPTLSYGNLDTYAQTGGAIGPTAMNTLLGSNKQSTTMNFSVGVQHQVLRTVLDISYVGGLSRHLMGSRDINPIPMYARFDPANQDPTQPGKPLPDSFLRPYRGYQAINLRTNDYTSNYNSLQFSANRRFTRSLQFGVAYTWSKALGVNSGDADNVSPYFSPRTREYGPLNFDRPHVLVVNYTYDLPKFGTKTRWKPAAWVLDGWRISGISTFMSGSPFTPTFSTTDGVDSIGSSEGARITVVGDPLLSKSERNYYRNFKTEVFRRTPLRDFGNAGVGILYGPGVNNWDIAVSKRISLGSEARFIQFRTELFNAWNHTQFSGLYTAARFDPLGNQVEPSFGAYSSARAPRLIQFSLKAYF